MIAIAKTADWISPEEYLEGERSAQTRHEYVDGRVFAMAGASRDHNRIAGNLHTELALKLRGGPCEPFMNDLRLRIPEPANVYYYPNVLIACDPDDNAKYHVEHPSYIFEVISPDTERVDRREKMLAYRAISGIKAYVILEQDQIQATMMRPATEGWKTEIIRGGEALLKLPDLNIEIPLARIYERTEVARQTG
jgi:Uma2 family endonuclease